MKTNERGQVILFIVIAMVIALGLGVAVSARTISSLSRVSDTDTSSRILASAEGGAERFLQKSYVDLERYMDDPNDPSDEAVCPTYDAVADPAAPVNECIITYDYSSTPPNLRTRAVVYVQPLNEREFRLGQIQPGEVKEIRLQSYTRPTVGICWSSDGGAADEADIIFMGLVESDLNQIQKGYASADGDFPENTGGFLKYSPMASSPYPDYEQCVEVTARTDSNIQLDLIRLRPVNANVTKALVYGVGGVNLPNQGFTIVSVGEVVNAQNTQRQIRRSVRVTKTYPYASLSLFDYAIYSHQGNILNN